MHERIEFKLKQAFVLAAQIIEDVLVCDGVEVVCVRLVDRRARDPHLLARPK